MRHCFSLIFIFIASFSYEQCTFEGIHSFVVSDCDINGNVSISGVIEFTNPPASGALYLMQNNGYSKLVASAPFSNVIAFSGDGFSPGISNTTVQFSLNNAGGSTACESPILPIVIPSCQCSILNVSLNLGACKSTTNTYDLSGIVDFSLPPNTGSLVINSSNGSQLTFNAPFVSPLAFTFPDEPANGQAVSVDLSFSDAACTFNFPFTNRISCSSNCQADAGTFTSTILGQSNATGPFDLCFDDILTISTNSDFVLPVYNPTVINNQGNASTYDPGLSLLGFNCAPTHLPPSNMQLDPCYLGIMEIDSPPWIFRNDFVTNETFFLSALTMYSKVDGIYDVIDLDGNSCFDLGDPIQVNFLTRMSGTATFDCIAGTASVTMRGSKPSQTPGELFHIEASSLFPAHATIITGSGANDETLVIGGLLDGDAFSFLVKDGVGCGVLVEGIYVGAKTTQIAYSKSKYCKNDPNITPLITGVSGGTFTSTIGLTLNSLTGEIQPGSSIPGVYSILYTPPGGDCNIPTTVQVTINALPTVTTSVNQTICNGETTNIEAFGALIYTWDNGLGIGSSKSVSPNGDITYTVIGEDGEGCKNTSSTQVIVHPEPVLTGTQTLCLNTTSQLVFSETPNAVNPFTSTNTTVATVSNTGLVTAIGTGFADIVYTTQGGCENTIRITVSSAVILTVNNPTVCPNSSTTINVSGAQSYTWSPATNLNTTTGSSVVFNGSQSTVYTIIGINADGCQQTVNAQVTVNTIAPMVIARNVNMCEGSSVVLTASGADSYSWNQGLGVGQSHTVQPNTTTTYVVTATDVNGCVLKDSTLVTLSVLPSAIINGTTSVCQNGGTFPVVFTGINGVAPYTFTYSINGGADLTVTSEASSENATVLVPLSTAGVFTYTLKEISDASLCTNLQSGTAIVTVNSIATASISGTTSVCKNDISPVITFTGSNGTAPYSFTYTVNGGTPQIINSIGNSVTLNVPTVISGTFDYALIAVSDANSCQNQQLSSAVVVVNELPTINLESVSGGIVCENETNSFLTIQGLTGLAPYTVKGTIGNTTVPLQMFDVATNTTGEYLFDRSIFTTSGAYEFTFVEVIDANGCSTPLTETINLNFEQSATASISADTLLVCQLDDIPHVKFQELGGFKNINTTFYYTVNGGAEQSIQFPKNEGFIPISTNTAGLITIDLIGLSHNGGCRSLTPGQISINVMAIPSPIIEGQTTYCEGSQAEIRTVDSYTSYLWSNGSTSRDTEVTIADNPIRVTVTTVDGCVNSSPIYTVTESLPGIYNGSIQTCEGTGVFIHGVEYFRSGIYSHVFTGVNGCDSTSNITLLINPLPVVTISGDQTICSGNSVTLTASGAISYSWNNGLGIGATKNVTPITSTTYTVTGTDNFGCSNTSSHTITAKPLPTATISGTVDVCVDEVNPTLTFTGTNGVAPFIFTYTINGGAAQTLTSTGNTATITVETNVTGVFTYVLTNVIDADLCSQNQNETAIVTINPRATAVISGTTVSCEGDVTPLVVTFTGTNGTAPYTFTYTLNGGANQTVTSIGDVATLSLSTLNTGIFTYNLVAVIDSKGCEQAQVGTAVITINSLSNATISGTTSVCQNEMSPKVKFKGTNGTAPYTFSYTINGGELQTIVSTADSAIINVSTATAGVFTYSLVSVHDTNLCEQQIAASAVVTINALPTVSAGADKIICTGGSVTLIGTGIVGGGAYTWDNGVVNNIAFIPVAGIHVYTVIGTDANGCSNTDDMTVTVQDTPDVSFTVNQKEFCVPAEVELINTSNSVGENCVWTIQGLAPILGCANQNVTINKSGHFNVTLTMISNSGTCVGSMTLNNSIRIDPTPVAQFSYTPDEVTVINNLVSFRNESSGGKIYEWDFGNGNQSTVLHPVEIISNEVNAFNVTLIVTSELGCKDTAHTVIKVEDEFAFFVPNAFTPDGSAINETFTPVFPSGYDPYDYLLIIYNRWGEMVFESHDASIGWDGRYAGSICPDGMYSWRIEVKTHLNKTDERKIFSGHITLIR